MIGNVNNPVFSIKSTTVVDNNNKYASTESVVSQKLASVGKGGAKIDSVDVSTISYKVNNDTVTLTNPMDSQKTITIPVLLNSRNGGALDVANAIDPEILDAAVTYLTGNLETNNTVYVGFQQAEAHEMRLPELGISSNILANAANVDKTPNSDDEKLLKLKQQLAGREVSKLPDKEINRIYEELFKAVSGTHVTDVVGMRRILAEMEA